MKGRAGVSHEPGSGNVWGRWNPVGLVPDRALCFSHASPFPLRRLLIVSRSLHVADQTLLLTQFLETSNHLLDGFTGSHLYFEHSGLLKKPFEAKQTHARHVYIFVAGREFINLTCGWLFFKSKNGGSVFSQVL